TTRKSQQHKPHKDHLPQSYQQQIATTGRTESACANQTGDNAAQQNCAISNENQSGAAYDHSLSIPSLCLLDNSLSLWEREFGHVSSGDSRRQVSSAAGPRRVIRPLSPYSIG